MAQWVRLADRYPKEIVFQGSRTGVSENVWLTCERKNGERYVTMAFADNMREGKPLHFKKVITLMPVEDKIIGWMRIFRPVPMGKDEKFDKKHQFFRKDRKNAERAKRKPHAENRGSKGITSYTTESE